MGSQSTVKTLQVHRPANDLLWHWGEIFLGAVSWGLVCWAVAELFPK